jgi:hypothetical protein
MFIREKKNKSGVISVQVIDKSSGKYKVIKTIGSTSDTTILTRLKAEAELWVIQKMGTSKLDFDQTDQLLEQLISSIEQIKIVGIEMLLGKLFDEIGFNAIRDELFRKLVLARLCYPLSKLKTVDYLRRYEGYQTTETNIYRYLDKLHSNNIQIVFYDVTTLYFEIEREDDLRETGYSKEGKHQNPSKLEKQIATGNLTKKQINNKGYNKFLKIDGKLSVALDQDKIRADEKWDGLKGYITNTKLSKQEVIDNYNHLWKIEKAFRVAKTDLKVRPIFHHAKRRIEAHLCIAFVAYKIYKELERQLKILKAPYSPEKAIEIAKTIYGIKATKPKSKELFERTLILNEEQRTLTGLFSL